MALAIDQIRAIADRIAASFSMEVVEIEFQGNSKARTLCVFLEKNAQERARLVAAAADGNSDPLPTNVAVETLSGVTHEDCALFAQDFSNLLDIEDLVPGAEYTLEVSSPGLERKLSTPADYQRFLGSLVKLQTLAPMNGNRQWRGRLTHFADNTLTLDLSALKQKGKAKKAAPAEETVQIPLAEVEKANLLAEF